MSGRKNAAKDDASSAKTKSKASKQEISTSVPPEPQKQTSLYFKLSSIANLNAYSKKINIFDFKVEITHQNIMVNPLTDISGEIYLCTCVTPYSDSLSLEDSPIEIADGAEQKSDNVYLDFMYSITIDPTDIKDINRLVETPLLVTLYQLEETISSPKASTAETEEKLVKEKPKQGNKNKPTPPVVNVVENDPEPIITKEVVGYVFIDLMNFIHENAVSEEHQIYIYPIKVHAELKTPIMTVEITSEEPLCQLAGQFICNIATITMENIFNPPILMLSPTTEIIVDISLKHENEEETVHQEEKIATFSQNTLCTYQPNELQKKWKGFENFSCIGLLTNLDVKDNLSGIYNTQNVDLSSVQEDSHVVRFNSICRKMLTNEICIDLEHLINYNEQQLFVEVHFENSGPVSEDLKRDLQSKYIGSADLSPLLFPGVTTGRFVVPLEKVEVPDIPESVKSDKKPNLKRAPPPKIERSASATVREATSVETLPTKPTGALGLRRDIDAASIGTEELLKDTRYTVASEKDLPYVEEEFFLIFEVTFETPVTEVLKKEKTTKPVWNLDQKNEEPVEDEATVNIAAEKIEIEFEREILNILKNLPYHLESAVGFLAADVAKQVKRIPYLKQMQSNMVNTIMNLVAVKYNHWRNTNSSSNFKNLLAVVYNDLSDRIMMTVNEYFSGTDTRLILKERERKDLHVFLAKEFRALEYESISEHIYMQKLNDPNNYQENLMDLAINDLENLCFHQASEKVQQLLVQNPKHVYGLLIQAYIEFISTGLEKTYPLLLKIVQECPDNVEIWTLLFVLYKSNNYRAGYIHAKTTFERYCAGNLDWLPYFTSRKEPYFEASFDECAPYNCIYIFLKLGMFKFADILYRGFSDRIKEKDRIIITSSIYLMTTQYEDGLANLENFKQNASNEMLLRLYKGHFLYAMDKKLEAIQEYQVVFHSQQSQILSQIANLRCGFWDINEMKFNSAKTYFSSCAQTLGTFLSWYGLGVCFYRTNQYEEAELCFSKASDMYKPFPELWVYLAIVNLKLNKMNDAAKCFETASKYDVKNVALWDEMINSFCEKGIKLPAPF